MNDDQKIAIRARIQKDVERTMRFRSNSQGVAEACQRALEAVAAERGISPEEVLRQAVEQWRKSPLRKE